MPSLTPKMGSNIPVGAQLVPPSPKIQSGPQNAAVAAASAARPSVIEGINEGDLDPLGFSPGILCPGAGRSFPRQLATLNELLINPPWVPD